MTPARTVRASGGDMKLPQQASSSWLLRSHEGMKISEADWTAFLGHVNATLDAFKVPPTERGEVFGFVQSLKKYIVEA